MILWHETARTPKVNFGFAEVDGRALIVILIGVGGFAFIPVLFKLSIIAFAAFVVLEKYGLTIAGAIRFFKRTLSGNMVRTARMDRKRKEQGFFR